MLDKTIMKKWGLCLFSLLVLGVQPLIASTNRDSAVVKQAKQSVVSIDYKPTLTAYSIPLEGRTTGVLVDKQEGYVLTNGMIGEPTIAEYAVSFFNGTKAEAKICYSDPWLNFAILKLDPAIIPNEIIAVKISDQDPIEGEAIFTITIPQESKTQRTISRGRVSDTNFIKMIRMPEHLIAISMYTNDGGVGSLVFNEKGEGIALSCYTSDTHKFGLHPAYLRYALSFLRENKTPIRKHIGSLLASYSLDSAVKYDRFLAKWQKAYVKKFQKAKNTTLVVSSILKGSPSEGKLRVGDIIWAIDGKQLGPSLVDFDMEQNKSTRGHILLTICRRGCFQDITIPLYNLEDRRITRMVQFGGTVFFETDDFSSRLGGILPKTLTFCFAQPNTIFKEIFHSSFEKFKVYTLELVAVNGQPIYRLDELITGIPIWIKQKYFTVDYINHANEPVLGNSYLYVAQDRYKANVAYDTTLGLPKIWIWNAVKLQWEEKSI